MPRRVLVHISFTETQQVSTKGNSVLDNALLVKQVFRQQIHTDYRSQLLAPQRMRRHTVHQRLLTLLQCVDHVNVSTR